MNQLIWNGPVYGQSGYEIVTREILEALDNLGIRVRLVQDVRWNAEKINLKWDVKSRLSRMTQTKVEKGTPVIMHQKKQQIFNELSYGTKRYCYSLFETDSLPKPWKEDFLDMDGIFTFSNFNKEAWTKDGISQNKIHVLPHGVQSEFNMEGRKAEILNKKNFCFVANGDFIERKNFELLIKAFVQEFKAKDSVCLILKTHYGGFTKLHKDMLLKRVQKLVYRESNNPPKVLFFGDKITTEDMANLYRACDCYVLPSRGEGLGLPVLETMACGLPIITTDWSALSELEFEGIKLPAYLETIDSIEYIKKCPHALNHKWANVHLDDLKSALRKVYNNQDRYKELGQRNAEKMKYRSWHKCAVELVKVLTKDEGREDL